MNNPGEECVGLPWSYALITTSHVIKGNPPSKTAVTESSTASLSTQTETEHLFIRLIRLRIVFSWTFFTALRNLPRDIFSWVASKEIVSGVTASAVSTVRQQVSTQQRCGYSFDRRVDGARWMARLREGAVARRERLPCLKTILALVNSAPIPYAMCSEGVQVFPKWQSMLPQNRFPTDFGRGETEYEVVDVFKEFTARAGSAVGYKRLRS